MNSTEGSVPSGPLSAFATFLLKALRERMPVETFEHESFGYIAELPSMVAVASQLLSPSSRISHPDPLHMSYIQALVEKNHVPLPAVLGALLSLERAAANPNTTTFVETALLVLGRAIQPAMSKRENIWPTITALGDWMQFLVEVKDADLALAGAPGGRRAQIDGVFELLLHLGGLPEVSRIYHSGSAKEKQSAFRQTLSAYASYMTELYHNQDLATQLESLYRATDEAAGRKDGRQPSSAGLLDDMLMGDGNTDHDGVGDQIVLLARGGIYTWVNSMLVGRPLVNDDLILGYLTNRYKGDPQRLITEFVTAVLDNVLSAVLRGESSTQIFILRSFLVNKVPLIISAVSMLLPPLAINDCLSTALSKVDSSLLSSIAATAADPFIKAGQDSSNVFQLPVDVRQEFLFACSLHRILEESSIQGILGDLPSQAGASTTYSAENLSAQFESDPEKIEQYLDEIGYMDGNAGAIIKAVVKTIRLLCNNRETMVLKNICGSLAKRPPFLDVLLMFVKPSDLLEPLCNLLDTWRYEEDQGEYQPLYEEFGFILLLVLAFVYRYDLSLTDFGDIAPTSFVPQLLRKSMSAKGQEPEITKEQEGWVGKWIKELFDDEGISNGLMGSCPPQEFYMLVPIIVSQSVFMCTEGALPAQTLKNGFRYLLEPFLLPSLLGVLKYLATNLRGSQNNKVTLDILASLIVPSSIADEARQMHQTVITLASSDLEASLREILRTDPMLIIAEKILHKLPSHSASKRTSTAYSREIESWASSSNNNGLLPPLRAAISSLVSWSTAQDMNPAPPPYSHKLLLTCCRLYGYNKVVQELVEEVVRLQNQASLNGDMALDIIASMLVAPTSEEFHIRTTKTEDLMESSAAPLPKLIQALYAGEERAEQALRPKDPTRETFVQLRKRIQTYLAPYTHTAFPDMSTMHMDTGEDMLMGHLHGAGLLDGGVGDGMMVDDSLGGFDSMMGL